MRYLFVILLGVFGLGPAGEEAADIEIVVTNITTLKGSVEVGVFNKPKFFLRKDKEYKTYSQKVTNDTMVFVLKGLKKDDYAISIYHDINSDNECNLNFLGIPVEPYGFSKNFKPKLSKPSFNDCKINTSQKMPLFIRLID